MHYKYVIAGTGAAGLSLAFYLAQTPLKNQKVLLIDKSLKKQNDRTWCFWQKSLSPYEEILFCKWPKITFASALLQKTFDISPYWYKMIRGIDFYRFTQEFIVRHSRFEWLQAEVYHIEEQSYQVILHTSHGSISADYVFDALWSFPERLVKKKGYFYWWQHFLGWFIETEQAGFQADSIYYMDFRLPQKPREVRFGYVLPYSPTKALVEFTVFSDTLLSKQEYIQELQNYIKNILGIRQYIIKEQEFGVIPMFDEPFCQQKNSHRVIPLGTKAGAVKASTGFAFDRIQRQTRYIAQQLAQNAPILYQSNRYHLYDSALLNVLATGKLNSELVFSILFTKHPIQRIFRFLDEESSFYEDLRIMASMPWKPFLQAIWENYRNRNLRVCLPF